jgi:anti-sigma factor ChrR (cupin superfamily)
VPLQAAEDLMNCSETTDALGALIDGTLDAGRSRAARAHLAACPACRALEADLRAIRGAARDLPTLRPPDRLWLQIAGRLHADPEHQARVAAASEEAGRRPSWRWLAVAAVLVLAVGAGVMLVRSGLVQDGPQRPAGTAAGNVTGAALVESIDAELRLAAQHYENAIGQLERIAAVDDMPLDPQTTAALQKTVAVLDSAIAESRAALRVEPANRVARESLFEALRRKVALLQDTIALMNEMRKADPSGAARIVEGLEKS